MTSATSFWPRAALLLALSQPLDAVYALQADAARAPVSPQMLEQKFTMVDKVLNQSPVARRVSASENEQARRHIANARDLAAQARKLSASGQLRGADALLNEAIWEVSRAQQLVPDPGTLQSAERARYSQLEESVAALQRTALIALPPGRSDAGGVLAAANQLVERAVALARADKYAEANKQLDHAVLLLLKDASQRLAGQTLVYDRRFADRREEFNYELERHRSFERLVPLALLELRPPPEARVLVDRHVAAAREQRAAAEAAFARDPLAAIRQVNEGTESLRRALQAAGLVVPQTMSTE